MSDSKKQTDGQLSILDMLNIPADLDRTFSPQDINAVIVQLLEAKRKAEQREKEERQVREAREREEKLRAEREAEERHIHEVTCMDLPLDWNNVFDSDPATRDVHFDSIPDALVRCLTTFGKVDIEYIASVTGKDYKTVIRSLQGSIYQNPLTWGECFYKGWETADEYLSGNLMRKWKAAKEANKKYKGYFKENIAAIEKVLPPAVATKDIYVTLGTPWIPPDIIDEFIEELFGDPFKYHYYYGYDLYEMREKLKTKHDAITGTWEIPQKQRYNHSFDVTDTWGTHSIEALYILEKTLNMQTISVTKEISSPAAASGKKRVIDKAETLAALEKQQKMIRKFREWVWKAEYRRERLEMIFENNFSCVRRRIFDGSFLDFPTMSGQVELYPYQKNAVARILFTPNTLLAHDVGAGKTYVMIAAGQEMRRMGISKKNMYVVPNNILGQWEKIFRTMYPDANLLCVEPKNFVPAKREKILTKIRDEDYDGIIIAYSCFEQIPLSKKYCLEALKESKEQVEQIISQKNKATACLIRRGDKLSKALDKLAAAEKDTHASVYFDQLGITRLFVDEAHNFKNVPIETKIDTVLGINSTGSKKCKDMMDKVHMIQKKNGGKGVVMATGTPITNSITDAYIMQQYLQSGELAMLDMQSFDSWVGMFAERKTEFEIDVDTNSYRLATRFSKFHNMPELTSLLSMIADFHQVDESAGVPAHEGYKDTLVEKTQAFSEYLQSISVRADNVRSGLTRRREDNMLKITSDGRKAALDLRLVIPRTAYSNSSKVAKCVENVADIYFRTMPERSTQLIFCDISTPKAGFNIYDELKKRLKAYGVPEDKIAFIHDAETETKRSELFAKVRAGEIRILIGSTFKLGLGVNIQDRLIALHHIDVPWRPADMVQREGRILRQGNMNPKVEIYRYITEGSFDAYSWQLLETKQRFISELLSGSLTARDGAEIDDTVLDYAEVKALAIGNPLIKERVETQNELSRYLSIQHKTVEDRLNMEFELKELPGKIAELKEAIPKCEKDAEAYKAWLENNPPAGTAQEKEKEAEERKTLREMLNKAVKENALAEKERVLFGYRGFDVVLPANMGELKPFVWLCGSGRYHVDMGDTQTGNLIRIDNFLEGLGKRAENLKIGLAKAEERERRISDELAKNVNYTDKIEKLRRKVAALDKKLGVGQE